MASFFASVLEFMRATMHMSSLHLVPSNLVLVRELADLCACRSYVWHGMPSYSPGVLGVMA